MITTVSCPACQFKSSIPEGDMGKRQVCSNCKSPFIAGASVTEPQAARNPPSGPAPTYQRTMLGDTSAAIKYNCPRCKAPLEALSIEAGTKKPCPACGQRIQVPAAPPPPAPQPSLLNKTMLTTDESLPAAPPIKYNCPSCKKPLESPASEAGVKKPCPACGQRHQVPAAPLRPNPNKTMLVTDANSPQPVGGQPAYSTPAAPGAAPGAVAPAMPRQITIGSYNLSVRNLAIGAAVVVFLLFIGQALIRGGRVEDAEAAAAKRRELEKVTEELERRKADVEKMNQIVADDRSRFAKLEDEMHDTYRNAINRLKDDKQKEEMKAEQLAAEAKLAREKSEREAEHQRKMAEIKAEADKAQRAQQAVVAQPPAYYYPYHWRYYYPW